ncbi:hypothetical protein V6N13_074487 [Hibiscus sabdariffa]
MEVVALSGSVDHLEGVVTGKGSIVVATSCNDCVSSNEEMVTAKGIHAAGVSHGFCAAALSRTVGMSTKGSSGFREEEIDLHDGLFEDITRPRKNGANSNEVSDKDQPRYASRFDALREVDSVDVMTIKPMQNKVQVSEVEIIQLSTMVDNGKQAMIVEHNNNRGDVGNHMGVISQGVAIGSLKSGHFHTTKEASSSKSNPLIRAGKKRIEPMVPGSKVQVMEKVKGTKQGNHSAVNIIEEGDVLHLGKRKYTISMVGPIRKPLHGPTQTIVLSFTALIFKMLKLGALAHVISFLHGNNTNTLMLFFDVIGFRIVKQLRLELDLVLEQEEVMWVQKARCQWIVEGDHNTKYFHGLAKGRRKSNSIFTLWQANGSWFTDQRELHELSTDEGVYTMCYQLCAYGVVGDTGAWCFGFAKAIGACSILNVELWGIYEGLSTNWCLQFSLIIIEIDSKDVVDLLSRNQSDTSTHSLLPYTFELLD